MTTTVVNSSVFSAFFEKQKLTGTNFIDWYHNLRIVLSVEDKLPYLEQPIPDMPVPPAGQEVPSNTFRSSFLDGLLGVMDNTNPPPEVPPSLLIEIVLKLNSILESLNLKPQSSYSGVVCKKEIDSDVMLIELIKDNEHPSDNELNEDDDVGGEEFEGNHFDKFPTCDELAYHKYLMHDPYLSEIIKDPIIKRGNPSNLKIPCNIGHVHIERAYIDLDSPLNIMSRICYNWIMTARLAPRKNSKNPSGLNNFTGRAKGMHIFIWNFTYVLDFMIIEDINSVIDPRVSHVIFGKPFVELSGMNYDTSLGIVRLTNGNEEITYKMYHKIEEYDSLSNDEKENMKSVYLRNDEDKKKGVEFVIFFVLFKGVVVHHPTSGSSLICQKFIFKRVDIFHIILPIFQSKARECGKMLRLATSSPAHQIPLPQPENMDTKASVLMEKYELGRLLGQGTFAKVYNGKNMSTGQGVAIKVIDKDKVLRVGLMTQMKKKISIMGLVKHPNVLKLFEVMATKTKIYFTLEYAKGGELFDKVSKGRMTLDFGLSALAESKHQDGLLHTTYGTPAYVAPKVIDRRGYEGDKADIWSCGVILYVLLTGYLPFHDSNLMEVYRKIGNAEFKCLNWFCPRVIISKLEEMAKLLNMKICKREAGLMKLEEKKEGRKEILSIDAEIFELTHSFYMVDLKKCNGDTLEYQKVLNEGLRPGLQDIVWTWQSEEQALQQQLERPVQSEQVEQLSLQQDLLP
ncbi:MAK10-like protein, partial [Tanacetum coccineum]